MINKVKTIRKFHKSNKQYLVIFTLLFCTISCERINEDLESLKDFEQELLIANDLLQDLSLDKEIGNDSKNADIIIEYETIYLDKNREPVVIKGEKCS